MNCENNNNDNKQKRKRIVFTQKEKYDLIELVKSKKLIWDLVDPSHCNHFALNSAWQQIADAMKKPVKECKSAWSSLKDSLRYHVSRSKQKKSGDAGGEILDVAVLDDAVVEWEFSEALNFLPSPLGKRTTLAAGFTRATSTPTPTKEDSSSSFLSQNLSVLLETESTVSPSFETPPTDLITGEACSVSEPSTSGYFYKPKKQKNEKPAEEAEVQLMQTMSSFIQKQDDMRFESSLKFADSLLQQLPLNRAQSMIVDFLVALRDAVNQEAKK